MSVDKCFVDTNILVYAFDTSAGDKHKIAAKLLSSLWQKMNGVISTQVLQEFSLVVSTKIPKPPKLDVLKQIVSDLMKWETIVNDGEAVLETLDIQSKYKLSFWDSLIIQAARRADAKLLYSEDLQHRQRFDNLVIVNPFLEE